MAAKNGRDDHGDPKIASLDAARKAAAARAKAASKPKEAGSSLKERIVGIVLIALAVAAVIHFGRSLISVGEAVVAPTRMMLAGA